MAKLNLVQLYKAEFEKTRKSLGQHFLINQFVINRIAETATSYSPNIVEIGPGCGVLTRALLENDARVVAVEIDTLAMGFLQQHLLGDYPNLTLQQGDALEVDFAPILNSFSHSCHDTGAGADADADADTGASADADADAGAGASADASADASAGASADASADTGADASADATPLPCLVSNLPYNISTKIFTRLTSQYGSLFQCAVLMFQKEVAQRLTAVPNNKNYSSLSVFTQYYYTVRKVVDVSGSQFWPRANVLSTVLVFERRPSPPLDSVREGSFFAFVRTCFTQKRKTLRNNLRGLPIAPSRLDEMLEHLDLPLSVRAEQLTLDDFLYIFEHKGSAD